MATRRKPPLFTLLAADYVSTFQNFGFSFVFLFDVRSDRDHKTEKGRKY